jgi:hypothetical protein
LVPTFVFYVDQLRRAEFGGTQSPLLKNSKSKFSVSKIRKSIDKVRMRKGGEARRVATPTEFMKSANLPPRVMLFLTDAFLSNFAQLYKQKHLGAFDISSTLRKQVPSLSESLIQSYSNWGYSVLQTNEGKVGLAEFSKKMKKELVV